jgi:hypothetical protein
MVSTSSRKRLIASPGESGRARAAGRWRMWEKMFFCSRAATENMKGTWVLTIM